MPIDEYGLQKIERLTEQCGGNRDLALLHHRIDEIIASMQWGGDPANLEQSETWLTGISRALGPGVTP